MVYYNVSAVAKLLGIFFMIDNTFIYNNCLYHQGMFMNLNISKPRMKFIIHKFDKQNIENPIFIYMESKCVCITPFIIVLIVTN